jgi:hypothetical protein
MAPLLLVDCAPPSITQDAGQDAPWVADDAWVADAPAPQLNCDDPALWAAPVAWQGPLRNLESLSSCGSPLWGLYFALPLRSDGPRGCGRVFSSGRADVPLGTFPIDETPTLLGLVAPNEVDVELRIPRFNGTAWELTSQRGITPRTPRPIEALRIEAPSAGFPLEGRLRAVLGWGVYANETELVTGSGRRIAHDGAIAFGRLDAYVAFVTPTPAGAATLHLVEINPTPPFLIEHTLALSAPIDPAHTFIAPFGVISGRRFFGVQARSIVSEAELPVAMDEVAASGSGALARAGSALYFIDYTGTFTPLGARVERLLPGGCLVGSPGEIVFADGTSAGSFDVAIGTPRSCNWVHVYGEHGIAAIHRGPVIGPAVRLFDPATEGYAPIPASASGHVLTRPDGTTVYFQHQDLTQFCE